jgi:hypothetical protein
VKVFFFSDGKDSFLTVRALVHSHMDSADSPFTLVLLTTFDETSRTIANQEFPIDVVLRQAKHINISLIGVPMHMASSEG